MISAVPFSRAFIVDSPRFVPVDETGLSGARRVPIFNEELRRLSSHFK